MNNEEYERQLELFALVRTMEKTTEKLTNTKDSDSLYSAIRETAIDDYYETGNLGKEVRFMGEPVGKLTVTAPKEVPQESSNVLFVNDYEQLARWFESLMHSETESYIGRGLQSFAIWWNKETGEVPDGCSIEQEIMPAYKTKPSTRITINEQKVIGILKDREKLPAIMVHMLGDAQ